MIRQVSPNERLYLACEPLYPPFLIQLRIEGEGSVDVTDLQRAVELAGEANPGSRLRLVGKTWVDTGTAPRVRKASGEIVRERMTETCEVVVIDGSILFRAFHGVMDARGLLLWVEDVFRALRGEALRGASSTMTDFEAVTQFAKPRLKLEARYAPVTRSSDWVHIHLDETTPNLVARVAEIITNSVKTDAKFMVPVDLRPFFGDQRNTGNFSNPIFLETSPGDTAADIQGQIVRKLAAREQFMTSSSDRFLLHVPLWLQRKAVGAASKAMSSRGKFLATATLSNLGRISLTSMSTPTFRARAVVSFPLDTPFCPLTVVMTEHDNGTELSISGDPAIAEKIRVGLTGELKGPVQEIKGSLFDLIERSDRVAIVDGARSITYRELDEWSSSVQLPNDKFIAVQMDHSIELIVAILAILKSGAAFVPLDPKLPQERIDFILKDCGATHVVRDVPRTTPREPNPGSNAYAIYTSGSTGQPKGVLVTHRNLLNYLLWARDTYGSGHTAALFTSVGFDLTLTSIFLPLISGGTIVIYENDPFTGFKRLAKENAVTFLKATPSHLRLLPPMSRVQCLVVGGEQLTADLANKWSCDVYNEYGPTEATIGCVVHKHVRSPGVVPIGLPIANTVVIRTNGELVIRGDCVAEGYLNRQKFNGVYRTGDLVTANADGDLVYLGRADRQLKVNGNRIEPGEIEVALATHPRITEAAVGLNSQRQLTAYFKGDASEQDARSHLESKLARAVVPTHLLRVQSFPLSQNGKIDFDQTPNLAVSTKSDPRSEMIRAIVSELLRVPAETIPTQTSLTSIGVDSLMLVQLLDRIGEPKLFTRAHEFAHDPTIARLVETLNSET